MNEPSGIIEDLNLIEAPHRVPLEGWLALAAVALAAILVWRLRRRPRRPPHVSEAAAQAAVEDALAELERLHGRIRQTDCRSYAIAVSGIVRRYIERRFDIRAPRRTTQEFLEEARESPQLPAEHQERLRRFLLGCDFLKFARGLAELEELEALQAVAMKFVGRTSQPPADDARGRQDPAGGAAGAAHSPAGGGAP